VILGCYWVVVWIEMFKFSGQGLLQRGEVGGGQISDGGYIGHYSLMTIRCEQWRD
jgi:hypothetical protein